MSVDTQRLHKLLEQASLDLVMLSPDNLVEVSGVLGIVESLGREFADSGPEWAPRIVSGVKALLVGVIRDEVQGKVDRALALVGEGITHLQELEGGVPASRTSSAEYRKFLRLASELAGKDLAPPPGEGDPGRQAGTGPSAEGPGDADVAGGDGSGAAVEEGVPPETPDPDWEDIDKGWGEDDIALHGKAAQAGGAEVKKGGADGPEGAGGAGPGGGRDAGPDAVQESGGESAAGLPGGGDAVGAGEGTEAPDGPKAPEVPGVSGGRDGQGGPEEPEVPDTSVAPAGVAAGSGSESDSEAESGQGSTVAAGAESGSGDVSESGSGPANEAGAGAELGSGAGAESESDSEAESGPGSTVAAEAGAEPEPGSTVAAEAGAEPEPGSEAWVEAGAGPGSEAGTEAGAGAGPGSGAGTEAGAGAGPGSGAGAEAGAGAGPGSEAGTEAATGAESGSQDGAGSGSAAGAGAGSADGAWAGSSTASGDDSTTCIVRHPRHPGKPTAEIFRQNVIQALESLQMRLVAVEQKADPVSAMSECIPDFRTVQAGFSLLDLDDLTRLTADTVALMDYVVSEQVPHTTQVTDILLKALTFLIGGVHTMTVTEDGSGWGIAPDWSAEDLKAIRDDLWDARQGMLAPDPPAAVQASSGASRGSKPKRLGEILVEKGLISEGDLGGLIQAQKTARNVHLGEILVEDGLITEAELQEALELQKSEGNVRRTGEILVAMGRLDHEHVEKALKIQESRKETKLGEILLQKKIGAPEKVAAALREQKQSESSGQGGQQGAHTVKVETQKLDGLIDLVGELVITQSLVTSNESLKHLKEQKFNKDLAQVSRITSELQRNAMSLRMVVIKNTFQKMNRLVRDLSHKFEKDIDFTTMGDDTEIDRNMVESIYDPLVHMIRNALDHGIEPAAERREAGKPPKGSLMLKAYHQGGNVVIELTDDGRGLNVQKVQTKAEELGLVQPGETLSVAQAHSIVFQPGFSTTDRVTEISGRGVGMDVVRKSIETLRGKVDFTSSPGQGSSFVIRLPLTLAIIDGMIVRVGDNRYILPTISINESFRPKPEEYFTVKNQGEMIKVRDNLLPLVRLDQIVNVDGATRDPSDALVVVVENEGQRRCLLVDEVLGKQEVVIKSLGERLKYVRSLAGGTILGDGRVGLILDVNGLFDAVGGGYVPARSAPAEGAASGDADDWGM